jgi:hypothetical protein
MWKEAAVTYSAELAQTSIGGTEKNHFKPPVRIVGFPNEIRIDASQTEVSDATVQDH